MNKKILKLIEQRLLIGEQKYGNENVTNDGRDFLKESLEEALDCCVYLAARLIELDEKEQDSNGSVIIYIKIRRQNNGKSNRHGKRYRCFEKRNGTT